jgi:hypothetical protein
MFCRQETSSNRMLSTMVGYMVVDKILRSLVTFHQCRQVGTVIMVNVAEVRRLVLAEVHPDILSHVVGYTEA